LTEALSHANDFICKRLAPDFPEKDGKQMPFRMHPVFVVQPATACCCRGCLEQWHRIPKGCSLSADEQTYILNVLNYWLHKELHQFEINQPVQ
jgi:hypothetical protein